MKRTLAPLLLCLCSALLAAPRATAQCGGNGAASFEFISVDNQPIGTGGTPTRQQIHVSCS